MSIKNIQLSREAKIFHNAKSKKKKEDQHFSNQMKLMDPIDPKIFNIKFEQFYMEVNDKNPKEGGLFRRFHSKNISRKPSKDQFHAIVKRLKKKGFYHEHLLTAEQIEESEILIFRATQHIVYSDEISTLKEKKSLR